jgi:anti-sigma regulatory factor (Ser/Thr protein kinase)
MSGLTNCAPYASAQQTPGDTTLEEFRSGFESLRVRTFQSAEDYGQEFARQHPSSGPNLGLVLLASTASQPEPRLRLAAVSAALEARDCAPASRAFVLRLLYDSERANRSKALDLVRMCYPSDSFFLPTLVDMSVRDQSGDLRNGAWKDFQNMRQNLTKAGTEVEIAVLRQLADDLAAQIPPSVPDPDQESKLKIASANVRETANAIATPAPQPQPGPTTSLTPVATISQLHRTWILLRPTVILSLCALASIHIYYLFLFFALPHQLFPLLHRRYPAFFIPYVLRPDLLKAFLSPARGLLRMLRDPLNGPDYSEYAHWLVGASRLLQNSDRTALADDIVDSLKRIHDDTLRGTLFLVLMEVDPTRALREMDLKPEDPEIRAARDNMSKIMALPMDVFERPGIQLAHALRQATTISADFYNVITRASNSYAVYMVDVDYHGLPASLDAMQVQFSLKAARNWGMGHPRYELEGADALVREMSGGSISVTMNFLEIDLTANEVRYASAGMPPALLFTQGQPEPHRLLAVGDYVGAEYSFWTPEPREACHAIGAGDLLVMCSDGILEARPNGGTHPFGEARLVAAVKNLRDKPVKDIVDSIVAACNEYSGRVRPVDDQSVIVIRLKGDGLDHAGLGAPAFPLRILEENELRVRATLRHSDGWVQAANQFVEENAFALARSHLVAPALRRLRIALQEAIYNAVKHGTEPDAFVSLEVAQMPGGAVEGVVTQQKEWIAWESQLGDHRRKALAEAIAHDQEEDSQLPLGGATLVAALADEISCTGRRLTLRFRNSPTEKEQVAQ